MEFVFLIVPPVILCGLLASSPRYRGPAGAAWLCFLAALTMTASLVVSNLAVGEDWWRAMQAVVMTVPPCVGVFLASFARTPSGRQIVFLIIGPIAYWIGWGIGILFLLALNPIH